MTWFVEFSDAITQWLASAPVWLQLISIMAVGIPVMVVLALLLNFLIDVCTTWTKRGWAAISPKPMTKG
ncbi:hypothetical protein ACG98H_04530 [Corynebacterium sp. L4756]|uniref:hypothetical protein n=1 Tax=unclassified Corynebacterium TaxID=2624378 RepID=UPI00374D74B1